MDHVLIAEMAKKERKASFVIKNCRVVNVFTKTVEIADIAIHDGMIVGVGSFEGEQIIDGKLRYATPGLIDAHVHIESSMLTPARFAELVMPFGTTSVIADPHEIVNVRGKAGFMYMSASAKSSPLDVFLMMPSCVPATPFESNGVTIDAAAIQDIEREERAFGLGEVMDYPAVIQGKKEIYEKLALFEGRIKDGHAPFVSGSDLDSYLLSGISTDHESSTKEEMFEKVSKGMFVMLREGSATRNVAALAPHVDESFSSRLGFCTDDKHPSDILKEGHINFNLKKAVSLGVSPITAIQMATMNTARHYHLDSYGAIAPGYIADLVLFDDLKDFVPSLVVKHGKIAAQNGKPLFAAKHVNDQDVVDTVHLSTTDVDLTLRLTSPHVKAIGFIPDNVTTTEEHVSVRVENNCYIQENHLDLLKIAVIERHHATGRCGIGLIKGYGLQGGAIAMTIAHDSHNLVVIGDDDGDMQKAIQEIHRIQGGIVLVKDHVVFKSLRLEIGGLMTTKDAHHAQAILSMMEETVRGMGVSNKVGDPFLNLAFLSLPVIPSLKITDRGLFDVTKFQLVPVETE